MSQRHIAVSPLPHGALLARYAPGEDNIAPAYTDAFSTSVPEHRVFADYVHAFYTTRLFRLERFILARAGIPSSDEQLLALLQRRTITFAAWTVEARTHNQLLLRDVHGRTRSWLMLVPGESQTTLYFGSAVVARRPTSGPIRMSWLFRVMLPLHRLYSRALLASARSRLSRPRSNGRIG
ncbi:MAG: hypothetical protein AAFZ58_06330 [Pseudomonadota bacterium]